MTCAKPLLLWAAVLGSVTGAVAAEIAGPLRKHPENGRYFTDDTRDASGAYKAIYLTGSHTWANLIDRGPTDPPAKFNFSAYLDLLQAQNHNFIRMWARHVAWYHDYGEGELFAEPLAWERTGPDKALDGKPKFDLAKLNENYFARLRTRVKAAGERGIYVSVMLFGGHYQVRGGWRGNPFHRDNNVNGIDPDPERAGNGLQSHTLKDRKILGVQENYVRKVVDTLNDLDNVLFEISNEGDESSWEWQEHWVRFIHAHEKSKAKQHPIGLTALYMEDAARNNRLLEASSADWISPLVDAKGIHDLPAAGGSKVGVLDSDHWFVKEIYGDAVFGRDWVWKAFCRGYNTILMEHLPPVSFVDRDYPSSIDDPGYVASRAAMGHTRRFADRMKLALMKPHSELAPSGFCLANPGHEYIVYAPVAGEDLSVQLEPGEYDVDWFDAVKGEPIGREKIKATGQERFDRKGAASLVLYLRKAS